ncbi:unnamed protein product [Caenorhabditis sp. 36 PRJEB53466]|nr:unnamed protein product [Caenorhabditis sp. 36 PRJEB53466]
MSTTERKTKTDIDLNKVPGLDHHRTAVTFNCLILKMLEILNHFGNEMEEVLERADSSLTTADRKLRLLEAKLEDVQLEPETNNVQKPPATSSEATEASTSAPEAKKPEVVAETTPAVVEMNSPEPSTSTSQTALIKDDPAFAKYFKMLKMGVPEAGVIQKMASEGVDPSILQRGDEPSILQIQLPPDYDSSGESVSSFSDSD